MLRWGRLSERSGLRRIIKASVFVKLVLTYPLDIGEVGDEAVSTGVRDFRDRLKLRLENEIIHMELFLFLI